MKFSTFLLSVFSFFVLVLGFGSPGIAEAQTCEDNGFACIHSDECPSGFAEQSGTCNWGYTCCGISESGAGTCKEQGGKCRPEGECISGEYEDKSAVCAPSSYTCCIKQSGSSDLGGGSTATGSDAFTFNNPLEFNTVQDVLGVALTAIQGVIVLLALVFIVLGAVLYITSSGNERALGAAKKMILAAMIGLAIGIAAPSFLKEIAEILNWGGSGEEIPEEVQQAQTLSQIAENLLGFLLSMVGILGIVMIVIGGLMYFAAAGDEKRADTAKKIILYSIIGVAVALTALIIVRTIASFFVAG